MFNIFSHGKCNQKCIEIPSHPGQNSYHPKKKKNEEDVGEKEHLQPIGKNVNYCSHSGNQYESSSEN
jgi:hypothetical protein